MSFSSVLTGGGFPGLLQWIRANETSGATFADSGGGGHSLTIPAGVTLNQTGLTGDGDKACLFGGSQATLATAAWMNITGSWWCVFLIKTTGTGTERHLFSRYTNNTNLMFSVGVSATNKAIVRIRTSSGFTATGTTTVTDGAVHLGMATWDGSNLRLYVDGNTTPEATTAAAGTISTGQTLRWGGGYGASTWTSGDLMDDVAWGGGAGVPSGSDFAALYASISGAVSTGATGAHTSGGSSGGVVGTVASATGAHTSGGTTDGRVDTTTGATGAATAGGTAGGTVARSTGATGAHTTAASGDGAVVAGLSGDADGDVSAGGSAAGFVARSTTATDSTTAGGTAAGTAGFSGAAAAAETSGGTTTGATGATSSATGAHTAGGSAGGMLGLARDAATGVHTVGGSTAGSVTGAGSTIRYADGTTLINPRYADGTTLIVRGWLDADGVTIHPFT